jgi:hypothetical protein
MALRYLLLFLLPMSSIWLIEYATFPLQEELRLQARDWLNRALSSDPEVSRDAYRSVGSADFHELSWRVEWFFRGGIALSVVIFSFLIPRRSKSSTESNLLTVMCASFVIAKATGGLHQLSWPELSGVLLTGLMAAILLMRVRSRGPQIPI